MIDIQQIKSKIDCRDLIERDLGKPKYRTQRYSTFRCPLHQEQKGHSLVVYADGWHCFGKCGRGGDALDWLQTYHHLSFLAACDRLTSGNLPRTEADNQPHHRLQPISEPPDADWQRAAREVIDRAVETLWSHVGQPARHYLTSTRGLTEEIIRAAQLGYIPGDYRAWRTICGMAVPCGITIPWIVDGAVWGIKVRRAAGQVRYQQVKGGNIQGGLYLADAIEPGLPLFITEGEFDALTVRQIGVEIVSATSIGSAVNWHISSRWYPRLMAAPSILLRMDDDAAGEKATRQLSRLSQAVKPVQVPMGKDVNEFLVRAGDSALRAWLDAISRE